MGRAGRGRGGKQRANVTTNSVRKVCNACEAGGGGAGRRARRSILYIIINKKSSQILPRTRRGAGRAGPRQGIKYAAADKGK